jgi:phosphohistidine phosphatase
MKKQGLDFDWILTSPLKRAYQTAKIVAEELDLGNILREEPRLGPGFDPDKLLAILQEFPGAQSLLLVGHEPGFSTTASHLIGGGRLVCKKGSLLRIDLEEPLTLQGELVWLIPPAVLAD